MDAQKMEIDENNQALEVLNKWIDFEKDSNSTNLTDLIKENCELKEKNKLLKIINVITIAWWVILVALGFFVAFLYLTCK